MGGGEGEEALLTSPALQSLPLPTITPCPPLPSKNKCSRGNDLELSLGFPEAGRVMGIGYLQKRVEGRSRLAWGN